MLQRMKRKKPSPPKTHEELEARLLAFIDTFEKESDRGAVLVATALLEESLECVIRSRISDEPHVVRQCVEPLFLPEAPLASFAAKIKISRALDFISDWMFDDLERIRKLRNQFAHIHGPVSFADPAVIQFIQGLKTLDYVLSLLSLREKAKPDSDRDRLRLRFLCSTSYLIMAFQRHAALRTIDVEVETLMSKTEDDLELIRPLPGEPNQ